MLDKLDRKYHATYQRALSHLTQTLAIMNVSIQQMVETSSFVLTVLQFNLETWYMIYSFFKLKLTLRTNASVI